MIYCMKCGSKLPNDARFCKYCGSSTDSDEEAEYTSLKKIIPTTKVDIEPPVSQSAGPISRSPRNYERTPENVQQAGAEPKIPSKTGKWGYEKADRPVKEPAYNPFDRPSRNADNYYIDNEFHSGLARKNIGGIYNDLTDSMEGGKWGFVDSSGKEVIPVIYDNVSIFENGFAKVWLNGRCFLLNNKGVEVISAMNAQFRKAGKTNLLYDFTIGISSAWFAIFGEIVLLTVVNHILPLERNISFWLIVAITGVITLVLLSIVIGSIRSQINHRITD